MSVPRFGRRSLLSVVIMTTLASVYLWASISQPFEHGGTVSRLSIFSLIKDDWINNPLGNGDFGKMGRRVQSLRIYLEEADKSSISAGIQVRQSEELAASMFPFLKTNSSNNQMPLQSLRQSFISGSRGIVIPVGKKQFRFAAHVIITLRDVLNSTLPIQVVYAGEEDLSRAHRAALVSLGPNIEAMDVTTIFNNDLLQLQGSWAIKPFAVLASKFEQVILLDADAVMLQDPAVVFQYQGYKETGTYLFHDRLLWQHGFKERHDWWEKEMDDRKPSSTLLKSLVWTEEYAEEQDSGMVVLDKSRLVIFTALLHICWQNSLSVRERITYRITYGDKESWWFGLELSGAEYVFEESYGSIAGYVEDNKVCSFTIAHPDADNSTKLLWYNGSLLKNKEVSATEFMVPEFWMKDAEWLKGGSKPDMSCMKGGEIRRVVPEQVRLLQESVAAAKRVDERFSTLL